MKKHNWLFLALMLVIGLIMPGAVKAEVPMTLVVNGSVVKPDVPPQFVEERTFVPLYFAGQAYGADVTWDESSHTVTVNDRKGKIITMNPGFRTAYINGAKVILDQAPLVINNRTMIPLRQIGEWLGATVGWDQASSTVIVNSKQSLAINGRTLTAPVYQLPYGRFVSINEMAKPLGYTVSTGNGKVVLEQGTEKYTIAQADASNTNGWRLIDGQYALTPEFLSQVIGAKASWNEAGTAGTLDKLQRITGFSVTDNGVRVETEGKMTFSHFYLDSPDRIVIDFNHARIDESMPAPAVSGKVKAVRFSQYSTAPDRVRVVVEMTKHFGYEVSAADGATNVRITDNVIAPVVPTPVPTPTPQPTPPTTNNGTFTIVLDAGHGGKDTGAIGTANNTEKSLVLAVTKRMKPLLEQNKNFKVIMTREGDTYPTLDDRVNLANSVNADLFMAIHANSGPVSAHGTETYYTAARSKELASIVHRHLIEATGFTDRGVKTANYYVTKNTNMPSTLIEIGFLTNTSDNKQMLDADFQQRVAEAMVAAITEYYNLHH
ncbi:N-acetylmuramoyl-L-alanine amidase [Aneurinibacillus soli]|uniref:N-acetylmuramoyl-L-alanine amidase LytC n=1 Tax=Aneurinibacillus soli TaxID=1500254 RepID=A0A0U4NGT3_9BACL|nr:N-acetylmuramoyl-L-alanine amidase [Aneurinibacillus soli]PYE63991.1 N-acetylmuramoyl-L-alanine amidase [Aneurinibacillus soli]BAU27940.1 N-acetylmuramoyl-L-alanine amidase LytC precursor [Aneurinibacillus soli]